MVFYVIEKYVSRKDAGVMSPPNSWIYKVASATYTCAL